MEVDDHDNVFHDKSHLVVNSFVTTLKIEENNVFDDKESDLVVNSLPQKKQRKNFIRPLELSVSLFVVCQFGIETFILVLLHHCVSNN